MLALWLTHFLVGANPETLQLAVCSREGAEYVGTFHSTLIMDRASMDPAISDEQNARDAILQELKYVWGWIRTNPALKNTVSAVLSSEAPVMELALRDTTYGRDLALP